MAEKREREEEGEGQSQRGVSVVDVLLIHFNMISVVVTTHRHLLYLNCCMSLDDISDKTLLFVSRTVLCRSFIV